MLDRQDTDDMFVVVVGSRAGISTEESTESRRLRREVAEARRTKRDPQGSGWFLRDRARPATADLVRFIETQAGRVTVDGLRRGVEPIRAALGLTLSSCPGAAGRGGLIAGKRRFGRVRVLVPA